MRFIISFLFFVQLSTIGFTQTQINLFYNDSWEITEKGRATYFRNCIISTKNYWHFIGPVRDFYASGKIKMSGSYNAEGDKTGEFVFYYESGQIESKGSFKANRRDGLWEYWYTDGRKHQELLFDSTKISIKNYWDANNNHLVINGEGTYTDNFISQTKGYYKLTGPVRNGQRNGNWICYSTKANGEINSTFYEENFENGKFKNGIIHTVAYGKTKSDMEVDNKNKLPHQISATENFHFDYRFFGTGNQKAMIDYVFNRIEPKFSASSLKNNHTNEQAILYFLSSRMPHLNEDINVNSKVTATLNENGSLSDFVFEEGLDKQFQNNIALVFNRIIDLKPKKKKGEFVKSLITIPIIYKTEFKKLEIKRLPN